MSQKFKLIDTHCHLNFKDFKDDADEVIKKTLQEKVGCILVGSQYSTSRRAIEYSKKHTDSVWAVVGLHPVHLFYSVSEDEKDFPKKLSLEKSNYEKYLKLAKSKEVVGIGEVGLDYHHFVNPTKIQIDYKSTNIKEKTLRNNIVRSVDSEEIIFAKHKKEVAEIIELQKNVFREFVRLSNDVKKPLAIHCWNADKKDKELVGGAVAYDDILEIINSYQSAVEDNSQKGDKTQDTKNKIQTSSNNRVLNGVIHSFIGSYKTAQKFIDSGFLIGLNGIITYSESYDRLIKEIGLENIILETDAPYLTPNPLERYSRNESLNVKLVAQKIADVLKIDISEVEKTTTKNAKKLFRI